MHSPENMSYTDNISALIQDTTLTILFSNQSSADFSSLPSRSKLWLQNSFQRSFWNAVCTRACWAPRGLKG